MFEKVKAKAAKCKVWMSEHKFEIGYAVGAAVGIASMTVANVLDEKRELRERQEKYPKEIKALSMRKYANGMFTGHGDEGPTVSELSDFMKASGTPEDAKVIGAIVYTQRKVVE